MHDVLPFGIAVGIVGAVTILAVLSSRVSERTRVPAPAIFLVVAAIASDLVHSLGDLPIRTDQRIVTVALLVILFDGGMHIGWRRFRPAARAVVWIGVMGTALTAAGLAVAARYLFDFSWHSALLLGTALAPTDPAVVFSVLGKREIGGRTGTILEGESGANDPVAIALMVSLLGATGGGAHAVLQGTGDFLLQMVVGALFGVAGGWVLNKLMRHVALPNDALYPVQTVAFACLLYGATAAAHGSGFLAVFVAGILVGDLRVPHCREIRVFSAALSSLSEIVVFTVLGLTISLSHVLHSGQVWTGLALSALLIVVARPLLVGALVLPLTLRWGERGFLLWSGLKGAVPIVLATFVLTSTTRDAQRIYGIVFVVVLVSVVVQGSLVPTAAHRFGVPLRMKDRE